MTDPGFMESYKGKDWIETYTGRQFRPMDPDPRAFNLLDAAHSLAYKCRYNGHTQRFYSVAEHTCLMTNYAYRQLGVRAPSVLLEVLTHDWPETFFPDVCRPLKQFCPELVAAERRVGGMIREWLGLRGEVPEIVKELDSRIIVDERCAVMVNSPHNWSTDALEPLGVEVRCWDPQKAEQSWLTMAAALLHEHLGRPVYWQTGAAFNVLPDNPAIRTRDLVLADLIGNVGIVLVREDTGMMRRDPTAGAYPRPVTEFVHGTFRIA